MTDNYYRAHQRIYELRGSAAAYECATGCGMWAGEWALTNMDEAVYGTRTKWKDGRKVTQNAVWSDDPYAYTPLCRRCHKTLDDKEPGTGDRYRPAIRNWYVRRSYYRRRGLDEGLAGPRPNGG